MTSPINIPLTLVAYDADGEVAGELDTTLVLHVDIQPSGDHEAHQRVVESYTLTLPAEFLAARLRQWEQENEDLKDLNRSVLQRFGVRAEAAA